METKYQKYFADYEGPYMNPHLYTDKPVAQRLFEEFLNENKAQIQELEEFKKCVDIIKGSNALKDNNSSSKFTEIWGDQPKDNFDYFSPIIWKVLKSCYEKGDFDKVKFAKEYEKLQAFFNNEKATLIQVLVPLYNLKSDSEKIDMGNVIGPHSKLILRLMTSEDKVFLISISGGYSGENTLPLHRSDFILELDYYDKFYSQGEFLHEKIKTEISELVTALRLLKKGYVGASLVLVRHPLLDKTINLIHMDYDLFSLWPSIEKGEAPYTLNKSEIDDFQTNLQLLRKISDNNKGIAIRHFNSAYEKTKKVDKFLDLMITCEALFSNPGEKDSVTYKIAWRFSKLLGDNADLRHELYKKMTELYSARSQLVHGNKDKVKDEDVEKAENFMRDSLKGYLHEMNINSFPTKMEFLWYLDFKKN
jgi:hypothetical protein